MLTKHPMQHTCEDGKRKRRAWRETEALANLDNLLPNAKGVANLKLK